MNPFLHSMVAQPLCPGKTRCPAVAATGRRAFRRPRLARVLGAAGLAALAWSGGALALDINTATAEQLQGIRGIGAKTAQIIYQERERGGRYTSFEDLSDRVRGIGLKRADALRAAGLTIDGDPAARPVGASGEGGARASGQAAPPRR
uniref:ComEA family DNA-binding protein n=1 Tax=Castellaniella defragrans TaxID=75697 RepID=UPI00334026DD